MKLKIKSLLTSYKQKEIKKELNLTFEFKIETKLLNQTKFTNLIEE